MVARSRYRMAYVESARRAEARERLRRDHEEWVAGVRAEAQRMWMGLRVVPEPVRRCCLCGAWEHTERRCACNARREDD